MVLNILASPASAQQAEELPLSENGPYFVGRQILTFVDSHRENRTLVTAIIYPATKPDNLSPQEIDKFGVLGMLNAEPDVSDAPYPLILFSHWWSSGAVTDIALFTHLASQGFVVASIEHACDSSPQCLVDRPMDVFFVLDELAGLAEGNLVGVIDTDHAGVMGISFGGYTALATAGAQIDPDYFLHWAANAGSVRDIWDGYIKNTIAAHWDEVAAYRAQFDNLQEGEPWPSITDARIRAILPIVPSPGMLFGEQGLEKVTVPTLMLAATKDEYVPYEPEITRLYTQLGTADHYLISFIGYSHHTEKIPQGEAYYQHFSTAFFGYYLQGQEDYAKYLTADYVKSFHDLAWGIYEGK
jgi:predicted dienelactone hydrolase